MLKPAITYFIWSCVLCFKSKIRIFYINTYVLSVVLQVRVVVCGAGCQTCMLYVADVGTPDCWGIVKLLLPDMEPCIGIGWP